MAKTQQTKKDAARTPVTKLETKKKRGNEMSETTRVLRSMFRAEVHVGGPIVKLPKPRTSATKTKNSRKDILMKNYLVLRNKAFQKNSKPAPKPEPEFCKKAREISPDITDFVAVKRKNKKSSKVAAKVTGTQMVTRRTASIEKFFTPIEKAASDLGTGLGPEKPDIFDEPIVPTSAPEPDTSPVPKSTVQPINKSLNAKGIAGLKILARTCTQAPTTVNTFTQTTEPFPEELLEPNSSADDHLDEDDPNFDLYKYLFGESTEFLTPAMLMSEFVPDNKQQQMADPEYCWDKMLEDIPVDPNFLAKVESSVGSDEFPDLANPAFELERLLNEGNYPNPEAYQGSIEDFDLSEFLNDGTSFLDPLPDMPETTIQVPEELEVVAMDTAEDATTVNLESVCKPTREVSPHAISL